MIHPRLLNYHKIEYNFWDQEEQHNFETQNGEFRGTRTRVSFRKNQTIV